MIEWLFRLFFSPAKPEKTSVFKSNFGFTEGQPVKVGDEESDYFGGVGIVAGFYMPTGKILVQLTNVLPRPPLATPFSARQLVRLSQPQYQALKAELVRRRLRLLPKTDYAQNNAKKEASLPWETGERRI